MDLLARINDSGVLNGVNLDKGHIEHILQTLQADGVIDCERGGLKRVRAYGRGGLHLFPGALPPGVLKGGLLQHRIVGGILGEGGDIEACGEEDRGGGGGGGGGEEDGAGEPPVARVIRVGGRSESMIGAGAGLAARVRRSIALAALGRRGRWGLRLDRAEEGEEAEEEGGGGGGGGGGSRAARRAAAAAAAAAAELEEEEEEEEEEDDDEFGAVFAGAGKGGGGGKRKGGGAPRGKALKSVRYEDDEEAGESDDDEEGEGAGAGEEDEDEEEPYPRYRLVRNAGSGVNGFALSPCGVCPVFHKCHPLGVISPATCVYMTAWLQAS